MAITVLIFVFNCTAVSQSSKPINQSVKASFCGLLPAESIRHITFTEMFVFRLDELGKPLPTKRILGRFIKLADVDKCIQTWTFKNFQLGTRLRISLSWGDLGWKPMSIRSDGFFMKLKWHKRNDW